MGLEGMPNFGVKKNCYNNLVSMSSFFVLILVVTIVSAQLNIPAHYNFRNQNRNRWRRPPPMPLPAPAMLAPIRVFDGGVNDTTTSFTGPSSSSSSSSSIKFTDNHWSPSLPQGQYYNQYQSQHNNNHYWTTTHDQRLKPTTRPHWTGDRGRPSASASTSTSDSWTPVARDSFESSSNLLPSHHHHHISKPKPRIRWPTDGRRWSHSKIRTPPPPPRGHDHSTSDGQRPWSYDEYNGPLKNSYPSSPPPPPSTNYQGRGRHSYRPVKAKPKNRFSKKPQSSRSKIYGQKNNYFYSGPPGPVESMPMPMPMSVSPIPPPPIGIVLSAYEKPPGFTTPMMSPDGERSASSTKTRNWVTPSDDDLSMEKLSRMSQEVSGWADFVPINAAAGRREHHPTKNENGQKNLWRPSSSSKPFNRPPPHSHHQQSQGKKRPPTILMKNNNFNRQNYHAPTHYNKNAHVQQSPAKPIYLVNNNNYNGRVKNYQSRPSSPSSMRHRPSLSTSNFMMSGQLMSMTPPPPMRVETKNSVKNYESPTPTLTLDLEEARQINLKNFQKQKPTTTTTTTLRPPSSSTARDKTERKFDVHDNRRNVNGGNLNNNNNYYNNYHDFYDSGMKIPTPPPPQPPYQNKNNYENRNRNYHHNSNRNNNYQNNNHNNYENSKDDPNVNYNVPKTNYNTNTNNNYPDHNNNGFRQTTGTTHNSQSGSWNQQSPTNNDWSSTIENGPSSSSSSSSVVEEINTGENSEDDAIMRQVGWGMEPKKKPLIKINLGGLVHGFNEMCAGWLPGGMPFGQSSSLCQRQPRPGYPVDGAR